MRRTPRLALISIDPVWEDPSGDFVPFTYGVRKLEASILADASLGDVETRVIDLRSRDPEAFFEAIADFRPTMVGASLYLWSIGVFRDLFARVRAWDPSVRIVAGGPQARESVFALPRYRNLAGLVDAAVTGEGEEVLRALARRHLDDDWTETPGLLVPGPLGWRSTGPVDRPDIDAYPSPYQLGTAPRGCTGYLETFRGCPIHCNFCQWGEQRADRVYSAEYLATHLEGLRRAEVPSVFCLDAAFNLSPRGFRNLVEAERRTKVLREKVVNGHLYPTFLREEHVELLTSFRHTQVAIGIQSFNPEVVKRLGRPFDLERFERVVEAMRPHFAIELELMLGLPGDDPKSFRDTFERALDMADTIRVFRTLVLPDALLERADQHAIRFDPDTWLIESCTGWTSEDLDRELDHVKRVSLQHENPVVADNWAGFNIRRRDRVPIAGVPGGTVERLRAAVGSGAFTLHAVRKERDRLFFDLDGPRGRVVVEAVAHSPEARSFIVRDGVSYSHRGPVDREEAPLLSRVIDLIHPETRPLVAPHTVSPDAV